MSLEYKNKNVSLAKSMRKNATKQEKHLWYDFLSEYPIRFQRQKPILNYIVDFYCHQAKLAIEIDGSQHFEETAIYKDEERTKRIEELGLKLIRFTNTDIDSNFEGVCLEIDRIVKERILYD